MENTLLTTLGVFLLVASAQGLFFSVAQLTRGPETKQPRVFLALLVAAFALLIAENALWMTGKINHFVHLISVNEPLPLLFGPLIYFYFKGSLTHWRFGKKDSLHFIPFVMHLAYCGQFYFREANTKLAMLNGEISYSSLFPVSISSLYFIVFASGFNLAYCFIIWLRFYQKASLINEIKTWFLLTFGIFVLYNVNALVFYALSLNHLIDGCANYGIPISMSLFIYLFSWLGYVRPKVFDGFTLKESIKTIFRTNEAPVAEVTADETETWLLLEELMEKEKVYKNEKVSLDFLSARLSVSRNTLSRVINRKGMNFFEYVNHWRIKEAKKLLSTTTKKELNVIEVAYEVGFNNKVSFNKFFKKETGLTPTEFRLEKTGLQN